MRESSVIYPCYLAAWRGVLVGCLGWPEARYCTWVSAWEDRITRELHGWSDGWFYHEDEMHFVLRLLVTDELADRLQKQRTKRMYNDLAHLLHEELRPAIRGQTWPSSWEPDDFDWLAAKERVETVLQIYGAELPKLDEVTKYESRVVGPPAG